MKQDIETKTKQCGILIVSPVVVDGLRVGQLLVTVEPQSPLPVA